MIKNMKLLCIAMFTLFSTGAIAQNTISIQSTLRNITGEAVPDGPQSVTFKLYTVAEGGTALWTETSDVEVVSGIYSHELGTVTPLVTGDFGQQLFLGVTVNNKELSPRTKLGYAPYAMAVNALAANGESASFDGNGKFVVSDDMEIQGDLTTNIIVASGRVTANQVHGTNSIGIGVQPGQNTLDLTLKSPQTGLKGDPTFLKFYVQDENNARMTILDNGRVGIGIENPECGLHIVGNSSLNSAATANPFFWVPVATSVNLPLPVMALTARVDGGFSADQVGSGALLAWSDRRIKTNFTKTNSKLDLALLNQIEITEYDHIDKINNGNNRQKKVIAQQVLEVLPSAISMSSKVIPNVYEVAKNFKYESGILTVETGKVHDFVLGDKIDLKTPTENLNQLEVISVKDEHTFQVRVTEKPENVFVYGKQVDDFLSVDYDAISMLNVSATQELYQIVLDLQKENSQLKAENEALKSNTASLEDRMSVLEAYMVKLEDQEDTHNASSEK